jgi:hypothetical protein
MGTHRLHPFILVVAAGILACSDQGPRSPQSDGVPLAPGVAESRGPMLTTPIRSLRTRATPAERAAGELVARTLALALRSPAVGEEVKQALASSAVKEHKLHLSSFLQGRGGRILRAGYAAGGITEGQFQDAMRQFRQMEMYMPVERHRMQWSGGPEVLVAVAFNKGEGPVAFSTLGERQQLDLTKPPETPTIVITHIESDFADQIELNDRGIPAFSCQPSIGETLESSDARCEGTSNRSPSSGRNLSATLRSDRTSASGSFIPAPRYGLSDDPTVVGLYANFFRIMDEKEYWFEGDPEIEVHVTGGRGPNGALVDFQCAGEHAYDSGNQPGIRDPSYVFDMNGSFWSGDVKLLNAAQIDSLETAEPNGFNITIWEDDEGGPCNIHEDHSNGWRDLVNAAALVAHGVNAVRRHDWLAAAGVIPAFAQLVLGDDDIIGTLVSEDSTQWHGQYPDNTHIIMDGNTFNGRATLYIKRTPRSVGISGPGLIYSGSGGTWGAGAQSTVGTVYYTWSVDGEMMQDGTSASFSYDSGSSFDVEVMARDDQGTVGGNNQSVYVSSCPPPQIDCNIVVPTSEPLAGSNRSQNRAHKNK